MSNNPMDNGYVMVAERHAKFVEDHPYGAISTSLELSQISYEDSAGIVGTPVAFIVMKCEVWKERDDQRSGFPPDGVGHASMPIPGPTSFTRNSEVENAETSALGRALAMIGYHAKNTMASEDEIVSKGGAARAAKPSGKPTVAERNGLYRAAKKAFLTDGGIMSLMKLTTGKELSKDLTREDYDRLIAVLADVTDQSAEDYNKMEVS